VLLPLLVPVVHVPSSVPVHVQPKNVSARRCDLFESGTHSVRKYGKAYTETIISGCSEKTLPSL